MKNSREDVISNLQFNLALINCSDFDSISANVKEEPYYGMGKLLMGWHKDKLMVPGSSIGVFQYSPNDDANFWAVAVKKAWEVTTSPLLVQLLDGESYFMLGNFNEEHRHAVIGRPREVAESENICRYRFSTTYRLSNIQQNN